MTGLAAVIASIPGVLLSLIPAGNENLNKGQNY